MARKWIEKKPLVEDVGDYAECMWARVFVWEGGGNKIIVVRAGHQHSGDRVPMRPLNLISAASISSTVFRAVGTMCTQDEEKNVQQAANNRV